MNRMIQALLAIAFLVVLAPPSDAALNARQILETTESKVAWLFTSAAATGG